MKKEDFINGHTFLVDKPVDWTSFDVVNKLRYSLRNVTGKKKIKVGHAGTLDPFATGLLIICSGKATKSIDLTANREKEYIAEFELGKSTDSQDVTGEILSEKPVSASVTREAIEEIINTHFMGEIEQIPPMFSAVKVDGKRLYKLARKGEEVERKSRKITILTYEVLQFEAPFVTVRIKCSKGTYIRTLAHDLGEKLGCGAYCKQLQRTKVGEYSLENAFSVEETIQQILSVATSPTQPLS